MGGKKAMITKYPNLICLQAKMFEKPDNTVVSVGVATKPYPSWRLPGNKDSIKNK